MARRITAMTRRTALAHGAWMCGLIGATKARAAAQATLEPASLDLRGVKAEAVTYRGKRAIRLTGETPAGQNGLAMLKGTTFGDGTIELELAGMPRADAGADA